MRSKSPACAAAVLQAPPASWPHLVLALVLLLLLLVLLLLVLRRRRRRRRGRLLLQRGKRGEHGREGSVGEA